MLIIKPDELKVVWNESKDWLGQSSYYANVEPLGTVIRLVPDSALRVWEVRVGNQDLTMLHKRSFPSVGDAQKESVEIFKQILQAIIESN